MFETSIVSWLYIQKPRPFLKLDNWGYSILKIALVFLLLMPLLSAPTAAQFSNEVLVIKKAIATVSIEGAAETSSEVKLAHRWDNLYPGKSGVATYRFSLPPRALESDQTPYGLFINRVGNQAIIKIGNTVVAQFGQLNRPNFDSAKAPVYISLPITLLAKSGSTEVEIQISTQQSRWGGLSEINFGKERVIRPIYNRNYTWRQTASVVICLSLAIMGTIAVGIWWKQRDPLFGFFALTAIFGIIRMGDRILPSPPIGWPYWGAIAAAAFVIHLGMMARFSIEALSPTPSWLRRFLNLFLAVAVVAAFTAFLAAKPLLWTITLASLVIPGFIALYVVATHLRKRRDRTSWLIAIAFAIVVTASVRDFIVVRLPDSGIGSFSIVPHAVFLVILFMAWIIVERYSVQAEQYRNLNSSLEQRIADREKQLSQSFDSLQQKNEQQATLIERQRIMRDIHDGVGAQLVGLLNLINRSSTSKKELQEQASAALDEMRIAIDSLQPVDGDLVAVLATLRYRLQPRLKAVGVEVIWDVDELPIIEDLGPTKVLQIQRILLEAFTNIIKHAHATRIEVKAKARGSQHNDLLLTVSDNGRGFSSDSANDPAQHGLRNMKTRALAIHAILTIESEQGRGTIVTLSLPKVSPNSQ
jgi:signal transduction histidine kinase